MVDATACEGCSLRRVAHQTPCCRCTLLLCLQIPNIDGRRYPAELAGGRPCPCLGLARSIWRTQHLAHTTAQPPDPDRRVLLLHRCCTATALTTVRAAVLPAAAGKLYPEGLPIWPEAELERVIQEESVDQCLLSYSDLPHSTVMALAARCLAGGGGGRRSGAACLSRLLAAA